MFAIIRNQCRVVFCRRLLLCILLLSFFSGVNAAEVKDVRMWHAPDRSRIVFDMDNKVDFKVFTLTNPDRVVIDLPDTKLSGEVPKPGTTGQFIRQIRTGYPRSKVMRLVFDMAKPVRYFIQLFKPVDNYQYRLVVDYYHRDSEDQPKVKNHPVVAGESSKKQEKRDILVLVDPGHGGEDSGAIGKKSYEKNVVLQIARKLESEINGQPGMRAELSRKGDYYISLRQRTLIARNKQADLFVSIHADSFKKKSARGASVYALSQRGASSETASWLADKENAADLVGGVRLADKDDLLAEVLLDLSMTKTVSESISFGREVLDELKKIGRVHSEKVEQAGFAVLKSPDIPSILVETAYITNPHEEALLRSPRHQSKIAVAVTQGIKRYLKKSKGLYVK
ncbi:MAG: AMIN domain-containing protein [Gammaproteobacteria bacterium]|nr:AMIN domain-containing protein [Gammaproteobacteria bacterium]